MPRQAPASGAADSVDSPGDFRAGASLPSKARSRTPIAVWVLTGAFALLAITWSVLTPPLLAPDESAHLSSTLRLTDGFSWPDPGEARIPLSVTQFREQWETPPGERSTVADLAAQYPGASDRLDQMTQHPPLYYLIGSSVMNALGATEWRWDQALLSVRLMGALFGPPLVWLAWSTVHTLTRSRKAGIVASATVFLVPGMAEMFGVLNNDTLAILVGSVIAWLSVRVMCGDRGIGVRIGIGIALGVAGLVKGTLIAYVPLVILVLLFGRGRPVRWGSRLWQTAWPLLIAFACGQWWWVRNLVSFGTLQPYGYKLSDTTWEEGSTPNLGAFVEEFWRIAPRTFWGWFGSVNAPLPQILVDFLMVICIVLVLVGMFRFRRTLPHALILATPIAITAILMLRVSWGAYLDTSEFRGMHGRYFYPVILPMIALAALALLNLVREAGARRVFGIGAVLVSASMSLIGLAVGFIFLHADGNLNEIREGLRAWIYGMSPVPPIVSLGALTLFFILLALGCSLAIRELIKPEPRPLATHAVSTQ